MPDLTLRDLYKFCAKHALDAEVHIKPDGRGGVTFTRFQDRMTTWFDFDFEYDAAHLPESQLAALVIRPVRSDEEQRRLETPR